MMKVVPSNRAGLCFSGQLSGITKEEIVRVLGFSPNIKDDPSKVVSSWGFTIEVDGVAVPCGIWDYKGSHLDDVWSYYGPKEVMVKLFGGIAKVGSL